MKAEAVFDFHLEEKPENPEHWYQVLRLVASVQSGIDWDCAGVLSPKRAFPFDCGPASEVEARRNRQQDAVSSIGNKCDEKPSSLPDCILYKTILQGWAEEEHHPRDASTSAG